MFYIAEAPSNIALVKYWGKKDAASQIAANSSLSMTLNNARTIVKATLSQDHDELILEGVRYNSAVDTNHRVFRHLNYLRQAFHLDGFLRIESKNTFPTACGIASSASAFAALTIAALGCLTRSSSMEELASQGLDRKTLALAAKMGSGSAARSLWGGFVLWNPPSATLKEDVQPLNSPWHLVDLILLISKEPKAVTSTAGHQTAWSSPFMELRVAGIDEKILGVKRAIAIKDLGALGILMEQEAIDMHQVMYTSTPSLRYMGPKTFNVLHWLREERSLGKLPGFFTLDAGPNIHLICEPQHAAGIVKNIKDQWPQMEILYDETGSGPQLRRLNSSELRCDDMEMEA